ncbi:hypothetical protein ACS0PU_010866 [Formica fusca]
MPAMFLRRQIARYISRSIGSEERNAVAEGRGREAAVFIYHRKHRGRLKGATKTARRPPRATKKQSSLYRLQDRHQRSYLPLLALSLAVSSDLSSPHLPPSLSLSLSLSQYVTSSSFYTCDFFLSCSHFDPDFAVSSSTPASLNGGAKVNGTPGEKTSRSTVVRPRRS